MLKQLLEFKETNRPWHLPVLAGLAIGTPLLVGYFTSHMQEGKLASIAGLVILYVNASQSIAQRMIILMSCSFGILVSFSIGLLFSFHPIFASLILGLFAFIVHLSLFYLNMRQPPGNFFFIMTASLAICMPYHPETLPQRIGLMGIGTMISCF